MSRSGYTDDCYDTWAMIRWRGAVASAIRGKRGQALLRETLAALDAMPEKKLIPNEFQADGAFCTLGAVAAHRGASLDEVPEDDHERIANVFGVSEALVQEIMYMNDEGACWFPDVVTPEIRWQKMREWVKSQIKQERPE